MSGSRAWVHEAIRRIEADQQRSADTHLFRLPLPGLRGVDLYLKDESSHPTGSLKHRLARSLFLYGLCNGWITEGTPVVEASSGSTAISEAWFAELIGVPFVAVVPENTAAEKLRAIEFQGGTCLPVAAGSIHARARAHAEATGGVFLDQFTYAERATDWRGNNNIAESIFEQMRLEPHPVPRWIVISAGTGGTSATIGRYVRYRRAEHPFSEVAVADPENSVFADYWETRDATLTCERPSRIEGIGRPRVEPSFLPDVVDRVLRVPDAASLAAIRLLEQWIGRRCGGSTGTNLVAALQLAAEMAAAGERGSIVTLLCDGGDRYASTYYDDAWIAAQGLDLAPHHARLSELAVGR